jgi:hypothetical protein
MSEPRKDYHSYPKAHKPSVYQPPPGAKRQPGPISVQSVDDLKQVTLDYLSMHRNGDYYQAFMMVDKLITHTERVDRTLHDLTKFTTI